MGDRTTRKKPDVHSLRRLGGNLISGNLINGFDLKPFTYGKVTGTMCCCGMRETASGTFFRVFFFYRDLSEYSTFQYLLLIFVESTLYGS